MRQDEDGVPLRRRQFAGKGRQIDSPHLYMQMKVSLCKRASEWIELTSDDIVLRNPPEGSGLAGSRKGTLSKIVEDMSGWVL